MSTLFGDAKKLPHLFLTEVKKLNPGCLELPASFKRQIRYRLHHWLEVVARSIIEHIMALSVFVRKGYGNYSKNQGQTSHRQTSDDDKELNDFVKRLSGQSAISASENPQQPPIIT